jgi:uroporphyrin-III C-methyltransferase/precorrin-2 dehydrogenase/sirohydrochlorin ferrochelatase
LGIPLTHRGLARSVRLVTASCRSQAETQAVDWAAMADPATTLAIYMGHGQAAAVSRGLQAGGLEPETPVAVIENGTRPEALHRYSTLDGLADCARPFGDGPVMVLVGSVVALAPDYVAPTLYPLHQRAL